MSTIVKLSRPVEYKGQQLREVELHLEKLTGTDLIQVETQLSAEGKFTLVSDTSKLFQVRVAARAASMPAEVLEGLSAQDFNQVCGAVQAFLLSSGSAEAEAEPADEEKEKGRQGKS